LKRIIQKPITKLCNCKDNRIELKLCVTRTSTVGHSELFTVLETCAWCACALSTGSMKKQIVKALKDIIEKNRVEANDRWDANLYDLSIPGIIPYKFTNKI